MISQRTTRSEKLRNLSQQLLTLRFEGLVDFFVNYVPVVGKISSQVSQLKYLQPLLLPSSSNLHRG
jgi:hypothetical protein